MIYQVQTQFILGNDQVWVARIDIKNPVYEYDNEAEARVKATELQLVNITGRQYRVTALT